VKRSWWVANTFLRVYLSGCNCGLNNSIVAVRVNISWMSCLDVRAHINMAVRASHVHVHVQPMHVGEQTRLLDLSLWPIIVCFVGYKPVMKPSIRIGIFEMVHGVSGIWNEVCRHRILEGDEQRIYGWECKYSRSAGQHLGRSFFSIFRPQTCYARPTLSRTISF